MIAWPWRRGVEDAQQRLTDAKNNTKDTPALASYSRSVNNELERTVALNGFGRAIQVAMAARQTKGSEA